MGEAQDSAAARIQAHARGEQARKKALAKQAEDASTKIQRAQRGKAGRKKAAAAAAAAGRALVRPVAIMEMHALRRLRHDREMWRRMVPDCVVDRTAHAITLKWQPFPIPTPPAAAPSYRVLVQHGGFGPFVPLPAARLKGTAPDAAGPAVVHGETSCTLGGLICSQVMRFMLAVLDEAETAGEAARADGGRFYTSAPSGLVATPAADSLEALAASLASTLAELRAVAAPALPAAAVGALQPALGLSSVRIAPLDELRAQALATMAAADAGDAPPKPPTVHVSLLALSVEPPDDESDLTLAATMRLAATRTRTDAAASCALSLTPCDGLPLVALPAGRVVVGEGTGGLELPAAEQQAATEWLRAALGAERMAGSSLRFLNDLSIEAVAADCPVELVGQGNATGPPGCVRLVRASHVTALLAAAPRADRPALGALPAPFPSALAEGTGAADGGASLRGWWALRRRSIARAAHAMAAGRLAPVPPPPPPPPLGARRAAEEGGGAPGAGAASAGGSARSAELAVEWLGAQKLSGFDGASPAARALRCLLARATSVSLLWEAGTLSAGAGVAQLRAWPIDGLACPPRALGACVLRIGDAAAVRAEAAALRRVRAAGGALVEAATCEVLALYDPSAALGTEPAAERGAQPTPLAGARLLPAARGSNGWGLGEPRGRSALAGGAGFLRSAPPAQCVSVGELCCRHIHEMEENVLRRLGHAEPLHALDDVAPSLIPASVAPFVLALAARTGGLEPVDLLAHYALVEALRAPSADKAACRPLADALDGLLTPDSQNYSAAAKRAFGSVGVRHSEGYAERLACLADTLERGAPSHDTTRGTGRVPPVGSPPLDAPTVAAVVRRLRCARAAADTSEGGTSGCWPTSMVHGGEDWPAALAVDGALRLSVAFAPLGTEAASGAARRGRSTAPLAPPPAAASASPAARELAREPAECTAPYERAVRAHCLADLAQLEVALLLEWTSLEDEADLADMLHVLDLLASRASLFAHVSGAELPLPAELVPAVRTNVARSYLLVRQLRAEAVQPALLAAGDTAGDPSQWLVACAAACARLLRQSQRALPTARNRAACAYAAMRCCDAILDPMRVRAAERAAATVAAKGMPPVPPPPAGAELDALGAAHCEEELAAAAVAASELLTGRPLPVEAVACRLVRRKERASRSAAEAADDDAADPGHGDASRALAIECLGSLAPGGAPAGQPYSSRAGGPVRALALGPPLLVAQARGLCARLAVELVGSHAAPAAADGSDAALDAPSRLVPLTLTPRALAAALGASRAAEGGALVDALLDAEWGAHGRVRAAGALRALRAAGRIALLLPSVDEASELAARLGVTDAPARLWRLLAHGADCPLVFATASEEWAAGAAAQAGDGGAAAAVELWHVATPTVPAQWAALECLLAPTALEAAPAARLLHELGAPCRSVVAAELAAHAVRAAIAERAGRASEGLLLAAGLRHAVRDAPFGVAFTAPGSEAEACLALPPAEAKPRAASQPGSFKGRAAAPPASTLSATRAPPAALPRARAAPLLPAHERCMRLLGNVAYTLCLRRTTQIAADELEHFVDEAVSHGGSVEPAFAVWQLLHSSDQRLLLPARALGLPAERAGEEALALASEEVRSLLCAMHLAAHLKDEASELPGASLAGTRAYARMLAPNISLPAFAPVLRLLGGLLTDGLLAQLCATLLAATRSTRTAAAAAAAAAAARLGQPGGDAASAAAAPPSEAEAEAAVWRLLVPHSCRPHKAAHAITAALIDVDRELRMQVARSAVAETVGVSAPPTQPAGLNESSALMKDGSGPDGAEPAAALLGAAEAESLVAQGLEREDAAYEIFAAFDKDGDGSIDAAELGAVLKRMAIVGSAMPQHELDEFVATQLALADADASGRLSFGEFVSYYNSICDLPVIAAQQKQRAKEEAAKRNAAAKAEAEKASAAPLRSGVR